MCVLSYVTSYCIENNLCYFSTIFKRMAGNDNRKYTQWKQLKLISLFNKTFICCSPSNITQKSKNLI